MTSRQSVLLDGRWEFKKSSEPDSQYKETSGFPTEIFRDLFHHSLIPDTSRGKNEAIVQWVGEETWVYRTSFDAPSSAADGKIVLGFAGLDTFAIVCLNGTRILKSANMFLRKRVDVTKMLESDVHNVLEIIFEAAASKGRKIVKKNTEHVWAFSNGEGSRLAVRKAQYHYGWDWGPRLMSCGPWRAVRLEVFSSRISDVRAFTNVSDDLKTAEIDLSAEIEGEYGTILFDITLDGESVVREQVDVQGDRPRVVFKTRNPALWYPRGYGSQPLYNIRTTIFDQSFQPLDTVAKRIGIRKVELQTHTLTDSEGSSFSFKVNHIPIFCGGSNWIPADSILTSLTAERYRRWVETLANGNQIMIRVWGGGIYEDDAFYDACDEVGVLVWQDFMFACGNYPAFPDFLRSVEEEAIENVKRLRSHPCIIVWAGNNEDYQIAESERLQYDQQEQDPEQWLKSNFPARYIYEKLLKDVMTQYAPDTYYLFGSPYGGTTSGDTQVGDVHQWNVWHGTQEKYQDWDRLSGRFVSEFGMQALPHIKTVDQFFDDHDSKEKYPESSTVSFHNKAVGHDRRLGIYLTENLRYRFEPFDYYVYCTQVMQAECVASAFRQWKRQWKGPGREYCAGALVWQANDCWPCTSWSVMDYYLRPKLAYYAIKREMENLTVGVKRVVKEKRSEDHVICTWHDIEVWVCNLQPREIGGQISFSSYNLDTGAHKRHPTLSRTINALPSRSVEFANFAVPAPLDEHEQTVIHATLTYGDTANKAHCLSWPEPLKYAHLPNPKFEASISSKTTLKGSETSTFDLYLRSTAVAKSVEIDIECEDNAGASALSDNGFDMVPDVVKTVKVAISRLSNTELCQNLRVRYLGCEGDGWAEVNWVDG